MLDPQRSRNRQQRLLDRLESRYDAIVVGQRRHVYYLSSWRGGLPTHEAAMVLLKEGVSWLITPNSLAAKETVAADELASFEANWLGTQRLEQAAEVAKKVVELLKARGAKRVGPDPSAVTSQLAQSWRPSVQSIDPHLWQLRRRKDP